MKLKSEILKNYPHVEDTVREMVMNGTMDNWDLLHQIDIIFQPEDVYEASIYSEAIYLVKSSILN